MPGMKALLIVISVIGAGAMSMTVINEVTPGEGVDHTRAFERPQTPPIDPQPDHSVVFRFALPTGATCLDSNSTVSFSVGGTSTDTTWGTGTQIGGNYTFDSIDSPGVGSMPVSWNIPDANINGAGMNWYAVANNSIIQTGVSSLC